MTKRHPSGRPVRRDPRVRASMWREPGEGFRLPRLNPGHIAQATDTFAIGFTVPAADRFDDEMLRR